MSGFQENSEDSLRTLEPTMGERRGDQPRRKRASKACLACRRRKVRCDVAQRGPPCMNCFLDKEDCVVKPRSTKYRVHKRVSVSEAPQAQRHSSTHSSSQHSPVMMMNSPSQANNTSSIQDVSMGSGVARHEAEGLRDHDFHDHSNEDYVTQMARGNGQAPPVGALSHGVLSSTGANTFQRSQQEQDLETRSIVNTHIMFSYYPFIKLNNMSSVAPQDVNFLESQGCFRVPTRPILDEFVQEYFLHIHPILPIINEHIFWKMYDDHRPSQNGSASISLLVFHAMLFAASSFVTLPSIQKLGFAHNRGARLSYYRRANLLFAFDTETDPIAMAQATLLMSYYSPMRIEPKANVYWVGNAIQFAKMAEAHRYQTKRDITSEQRNTLKRLWWCCILRDRILPLGVRRSIQITSLDFDLSTQKPLTVEDLESEFMTSKVYDAISKRALAQRLMALCELAVVLTDVIMILYPEKESLKQLGHQSRSDPSGAVRACKLELNTWFEMTTVKCLISPSVSEAHESVLLYTNLMYTYYHSAILALCNYEVLLATTAMAAGNPGSSSLAQIYNTRRQIEEAIGGFTQNLKEIVQLKLAKYLPISMVAYIALPLVLHLLDVKLSSTPFRTAKAKRRLSVYKDTMKVLQPQYDVTDIVSGYIAKMLERMSLDQEEQIKTPSSHSETELGSLASKSTDDPSIVQNWGDVLLRQPKLYLRLAITMDLAMSKLNFPTDLDFPIFLQSKVKPPAGQFPTYHVSMNDTKNPEYSLSTAPTGQQSERAMEGTYGNTANSSMGGPFSFTPSEITPLVVDNMDFDTTGFELPTGFEAFDMELSSKRGFDMDPWADNMAFSEPI